MFATNLTVGQSVGRIIEIDGINATSNERWYPDGRVELIKTVRVEASPLYNHDRRCRSAVARGRRTTIAGVLIVDYWLLRRRRLQLEDLYLTDGAYRYRNGWNWNAVTATATGCALAWGGLVVPVLGRLYDYSWFVGLLTSAAVYWTLSVAASRSPLTAQDATR